MDHDFWQACWENNQIGFHREEVSPYLAEYWQTLALQPNNRVFVPMCGKSRDMLWLLDQGSQVVGVELNPLAVESFFAETGLQPEVRKEGPFTISEVHELKIICGDFFALQGTDLGRVDAVYDRAALVALPDRMRADYVTRMSELLQTGVEMLLITFDYLQQEMAGPPFSIPPGEVSKLYADWCDMELLDSKGVLGNEPLLKKRGLSQLQEHTFRLVVR